MLARWNPWQDLSELEREMSDLARRVFGTGSAPGREGNDRTWTPAVDVFSRDDDIVVRAELPGIDPEKDVEISFQEGVLTIRGERRFKEKAEREGYYRFESSYGSFQRSIALPRGVQAEDVQASYEKGILEVVIPKAAELTGARKIPVTAGSDRSAISAKATKK